MTTDTLRADEVIAPRQSDGAHGALAQAPASDLAPLYYALALATGLPPDALEPPPTVAYPEIGPIARPLVHAVGLETILEQPIVSRGRGRVRLAEVDRRLDGLVVSLDAFQMVAGCRALVGIGVVRADRMMNGGASTTDLWTLARTEWARRPVMRVHPGRIGQDAFLAVHHRVAQVAWLRDDHLLTVSVTCVAGQQLWMVRTARSIAAVVDDHLGAQRDLDHPIPHARSL